MPARRALVVEDSLLILIGLEMLLAQHQVSIVGPASTLDEALALAESEDFDIALLDINLHNKLSYPVADRLVQRGIPFIFTTAYVPQSLPARFMNTPFIQKPYENAALMELMEQVFASATAPHG